MELFGDPVTNTQGREVRPFKDFMLDIRYGTSQPPTFNELGEFKFIRATNIKAGRITENGMLRISADEAAKIEKCRLNGNEIIIVRSGANTGDTCVVTDEYRDQYAGYDIIVTLMMTIYPETRWGSIWFMMMFTLSVKTIHMVFTEMMMIALRIPLLFLKMKRVLIRKIESLS